MTKILVTDGLEFIGSNLVKELRNRGYDVWLCDLRHSEDPKSIRYNVSVFRQVERLFEKHDFEYVYHAVTEYGRWKGKYINIVKKINDIPNVKNFLNMAFLVIDYTYMKN